MTEMGLTELNWIRCSLEKKIWVRFTALYGFGFVFHKGRFNVIVLQLLTISRPCIVVLGACSRGQALAGNPGLTQTEKGIKQGAFPQCHQLPRCYRRHHIFARYEGLISVPTSRDTLMITGLEGCDQSSVASILFLVRWLRCLLLVCLLWTHLSSLPDVV